MRRFLFVLGILGLGVAGGKGIAVAEDVTSKAREWSKNYSKALFEGDCPKIKFVLEKGKALKYGEAFYWEGYYKEVGFCTERSLKKAVEIFREAASLEYLDAYLALARVFQQGRGVAKDTKEAGRWFRRAALRLIDWPPAEREKRLRGKWWRHPPNKMVEALAWLKVLEAQGPEKILAMGRALTHGSSSGGFRGEPIERDQTSALPWLRKAAFTDYPGAKYELAKRYLTGPRQELYPGRGLRELFGAALAGSHAAQIDLAGRFRAGKGVMQSDLNACIWLRLAERSGATFGPDTLAICPYSKWIIRMFADLIARVPAFLPDPKYTKRD